MSFGSTGTHVGPFYFRKWYLFPFTNVTPNDHQTNTGPTPKAIMASQKMRILVRLPNSHGGVLPTPVKWSIQELSTEVLRRYAQHLPLDTQTAQVQLSLSDGSTLFSEDLVEDVLHSDELVLVSITSNDKQPTTSSPQASQLDGGHPSPTESSKRESKGKDVIQVGNARQAELEDGDMKRVRIAFISPESARNRGSSETKKHYGFGGNAVSVRLTMVGALTTMFIPTKDPSYH